MDLDRFSQPLINEPKPWRSSKNLTRRYELIEVKPVLRNGKWRLCRVSQIENKK